MTITRAIIEDIRLHGETTYPEECCGFLLGRSGLDDNEVHAARPATNRNENRREDRYVIHPEEFRNAERAATGAGLDIVGIYHSHPDHPARPSQTDLETATFPGYTYVIVSVRDGSAAETTAWTLAPDRSRFLSEEIHERSELDL